MGVAPSAGMPGDELWVFRSETQGRPVAQRSVGDGWLIDPDFAALLPPRTPWRPLFERIRRHCLTTRAQTCEGSVYPQQSDLAHNGVGAQIRLLRCAPDSVRCQPKLPLPASVADAGTWRPLGVVAPDHTVIGEYVDQTGVYRGVVCRVETHSGTPDGVDDAHVQAVVGRGPGVEYRAWYGGGSLRDWVNDDASSSWRLSEAQRRQILVDAVSGLGDWHAAATGGHGAVDLDAILVDPAAAGGPRGVLARPPPAASAGAAAVADDWRGLAAVIEACLGLRLPPSVPPDAAVLRCLLCDATSTWVAPRVMFVPRPFRIADHRQLLTGDQIALYEASIAATDRDLPVWHTLRYECFWAFAVDNCAGLVVADVGGPFDFPAARSSRIPAGIVLDRLVSALGVPAGPPDAAVTAGGLLGHAVLRAAEDAAWLAQRVDETLDPLWGAGAGRLARERLASLAILSPPQQRLLWDLLRDPAAGSVALVLAKAAVAPLTEEELRLPGVVGVLDAVRMAVQRRATKDNAWRQHHFVLGVLGIPATPSAAGVVPVGHMLHHVQFMALPSDAYRQMAPAGWPRSVAELWSDPDHRAWLLAELERVYGPDAAARVRREVAHLLTPR